MGVVSIARILGRSLVEKLKIWIAKYKNTFCGPFNLNFILKDFIDNLFKIIHYYIECIKNKNIGQFLGGVMQSRNSSKSKMLKRLQLSSRRNTWFPNWWCRWSGSSSRVRHIDPSYTQLPLHRSQTFSCLLTLFFHGFIYLLIKHREKFQA